MWWMGYVYVCVDGWMDVAAVGCTERNTHRTLICETVSQAMEFREATRGEGGELVGNDGVHSWGGMFDLAHYYYHYHTYTSTSVYNHIFLFPL